MTQNVINRVHYISANQQGTIGLPLIFLIENYGNITWYVDASFVVKKDMRSHTGGFVNMGPVGGYVQYIKKK